MLAICEPAAIICGFAVTPFTTSGMPEIETTIEHLRAVLGDTTDESLARRGERTAAGEIVPYAFEEIELARAKLPRTDLT
jgi:hypothetical protein